MAALMLMVAFIVPRGAPAAPPANFTDTLVTSGFSTIPTDVTAMADSRLLITTQGGIIYTFKGGTRTTALNFASRTCSNLERGMFGVALDPSFASNHYVYVSYTFNKFGTCVNNSSNSPVNRVSRFLWSTGSNTLDPGSELVLLDNMPSPGGGHNVGDIIFAPDGTLVVSIGDGSCDLADGTKCGPQNTNARKMNLLLGKILRITKDGGIPSNNPYQGTGTARCNVNGKTSAGTICREIYATGFRNPFRIAVDPNRSGLRIHADDTGQNTWEEVDNVVAGGDYGWSVCEGRYQTGSTSVDCSLSSARDPLFSYGHGDCNAITGAAFVPAGIWPSQYDGKYLFGDYTCDTIWVLNQGSSVSRSVFATGVDLISMAFGPSGSTQALYYTTLAGAVRKIQYTGAVNRPPEAKAKATPTFGVLPLLVKFDGSTSTDPDRDTLTYDWDFGDGSTHGTGAKPQHTYTTEQIFTVKLTVNDGKGGADSTTLKIDAGNTQPQPTILNPTADATFAVGEMITLQGSATDAEDGTLPNSALSWEVIKHHADHTHPFMPPTTANVVQLEAPAPEDFLAATNSYLEIKLTATDSNGLKKTISQNFRPHKVDVTLTTDPAGLRLTVEGVEVTGPTVVTAWEGWELDVVAPASQIDASGEVYDFVSWSDGGARAHQIITPAAPQTYTANVIAATGPSFAPIADARVREANPNSNYGASTSLEVDGGRDPDVQTYLKFDVTGVGTVERATLWLYVVNGTVNGPAVYETAIAWTEKGITWSNRPARTGPELDNKQGIANNTWVPFDVTDAVAGNGEIAFVLVGASPDGITARSREAGSNRPKLVITTNGGNGDTEAPTTPEHLQSSAPTWNRVVLTWDAATDNTGVTGYDLYRDGVLLTSIGNVTTFTDTTVTASTEYDYRIRARDAAGNRSPLSDVATVTTPIRTTTRTFAPEADARVQENHPASRYGTSPELRAEGGSDLDVDSYLRFTISGLTGPVQRATLRVFIPNGSGYGTANGPAVYTAANTWSETTITWNTRPPRTTTPHDDKGKLAAGAWVEYDVTALANGNGTITFVLASDSTDVVVFSSREGVTPPQLVVVAAVGGGAPTISQIDQPPAQTPTPEPTLTPVPTATATAAPPTPTTEPEPTATETPAATPTPTEEPDPTATPTPEPTEVPAEPTPASETDDTNESG